MIKNFFESFSTKLKRAEIELDSEGYPDTVVLCVEDESEGSCSYATLKLEDLRELKRMVESGIACILDNRK